MSASPLNATERDLVLDKRQSTPSTPGTRNGYCYSWWSDGGPQVTIDLLGLSVGGGGNLVGGKGWNPSGPNARNWAMEYSGSYRPNWNNNPLVEYYVVKKFGTYNPASNAQKKGSATNDGGTYLSLRTGGTVTMDNHFAAWEKAGLKLGTHNSTIAATEGYYSSGSSIITVETPP
ncbi:glycoside hydrolase family 11 protein [Hypoxylon sp. FL1150]|nr:glycoside hydrolase family 11 protein [Hypoxylon sp. FL1150]